MKEFFLRYITATQYLNILKVWVFLSFISISLSLSAQQQIVAITPGMQTVGDVLRQVSLQTGMRLVIDSNMDRKRNISIPSSATTLDEVMEVLLQATGYNYSIKNEDIVILKKNYTRNPSLLVDKVWAEGPKVYYFPIDRTLLLKDFRSNKIMLESLDKLLSDPEILPHIDSILVTGAASPIASRSHNDKLSLARAQALKTYVHWKHPSIDRNKVHMSSEGIDWEGFWAIVENTPELPSQSKVLALKNVKNEAQRLQMLRTVGGDKTYKYLLNKIYPKLQYASARVVLDNGRSIPERGSAIRQIIMQEISYVCDTIWVERIIRDTILYCPDEDNKKGKDKPFYIALKNNLIYDIALLPNLTLEIPFGTNYNWSVGIEGNWSWWNTGANSHFRYYYHRVQVAGIEFRRWFGNKTGNPLNGWFVGAYGFGGTYDIRLFTNEDSDLGQLSNWSYSGGLTFGYAMPLNKRLNLEFGIGAGYVGGKYYKYAIGICEECIFPEKSYHDRKYIGPTKANISLVWLIGSGINKSKGETEE